MFTLRWLVTRLIFRQSILGMLCATTTRQVRLSVNHQDRHHRTQTLVSFCAHICLQNTSAVDACHCLSCTVLPSMQVWILSNDKLCSQPSSFLKQLSWHHVFSLGDSCERMLRIEGACELLTIWPSMCLT